MSPRILVHAVLDTLVNTAKLVCIICSVLTFCYHHSIPNDVKLFVKDVSGHLMLKCKYMPFEIEMSHCIYIFPYKLYI